MTPTIVRLDLPSGTVTFLFTDVEGSTKLLHELGAESYAAALAAHRQVIREGIGRHGGVEVDTQGDAFFVAFPTAPAALAAARDVQEALAGGPIRVRMGIHTGTPHLTNEGYVGTDVHRAARIAACGRGGQVLVSAATAALVDPSVLRDLGEHRLKDLSAPERIYQLGEAEFPPLNSLHQTNLPIPATPFLGRERALAEIAALLHRVDIRLVTLTGPGGTGKTRLALQAAAATAGAFEHGVWWVPLAPLRDPRLVLETAAQAIGGTGDLADRIGDRSMLLVFDNFEQVIDASRDLAAVLTRCPRLKALITSREPLHVSGEWQYAVDSLEDHEALVLFETRAQAVRRDYEANGEVQEICRRLDNLPLAIELAAARLKVLSPRALLERLDRRLPLLAGGARDAPERQRTLRGAIEWSHDLLSPEEQRLFARLAVFRGGFTLEAAESVAEADLDTLQSLVEKSLVRERGDRFGMLETIREYAADRLEASGETEACARRHAQHFLALAEEAGPHLRGDPREWLDRLERDHDNLRAMLDHLTAAGETQAVLRVGSAISTFWALHGHIAEGRRHVEEALAADSRPTTARANALLEAGYFAALVGDAALERRRAEEALALHTELGDGTGSALARYALANLAAGEGDWSRAKELMEKSVAEFDLLGDDFHLLSATRGLAWVHEELGDADRSRELTERNLRLSRSLGNRRIEARSLGALAMVALSEGRLADARSMLTDGFRIDRDLGFSIFVAINLGRFAAILVQEGKPEVAAQLVARGEALREELGVAFESWAVKEIEETVSDIRSQLDAVAYAAAWQEGRSLTIDDAVALALGPNETHPDPAATTV